MTPANLKPRVGISSCLYGNKVRYDGKHQRNDVILNALQEHVELVPVCPETGIGLGVPRPPIQLVDRGNDILALGVADKNIDVTDQLVSYAADILKQYSDLSGFIFKSRSPSCGVHDTPIFNASNQHMDNGAGIFTRALRHSTRGLPVEDDERLQDLKIRDNFIKKVITFYTLESIKGPDALF